MRTGKCHCERGGNRYRLFKSSAFASVACYSHREDHPPEFSTDNVMGEFGTATDLYFGGDMEASIALTGQVAGIDSVRPVEILAEVRRVFRGAGSMSQQHL